MFVSGAYGLIRTLRFRFGPSSQLSPAEIMVVSGSALVGVVPRFLQSNSGFPHRTRVAAVSKELIIVADIPGSFRLDFRPGPDFGACRTFLSSIYRL